MLCQKLNISSVVPNPTNPLVDSIDHLGRYWCFKEKIEKKQRSFKYKQHNHYFTISIWYSFINCSWLFIELIVWVNKREIFSNKFDHNWCRFFRKMAPLFAFNPFQKWRFIFRDRNSNTFLFPSFDRFCDRMVRSGSSDATIFCGSSFILIWNLQKYSFDENWWVFILVSLVSITEHKYLFHGPS